MRSFPKCLGALSLVVTAALFLTARPAVADTYSLYALSVANGNIDQAVYNDGTAMVYGNSCPATSGGPCYKTYDHGSLATVSATLPPTAWDNGTPCSFSVAGFQMSGRCNGNYHAFSFNESDPLAKLLTPGLYAGALDDPSLIYADRFSGIAALFLNSHGDLAFTDKAIDEVYQAYNTTPSPEPSTLLLLASGLGLGVFLQRRVLG